MLNEEATGQQPWYVQGLCPARVNLSLVKCSALRLEQQYLDLLHLLLVVDVHMLQRVFQLLVALEESFSQLSCQV